MSAKSPSRAETEALLRYVSNLEPNLDALETHADQVRAEIDFDAIRRFYHMVLLECAERMSTDEFSRCLKIAREQMRKPL